MTGIDREPQPRYPYEFIQADLRDLDAQWIADNYDVVTASPPCWAHSDLAHRTGREYEDFIPQTRALLRATGLPYVIENVEGSPLLNPIILCGTQFPGLRVIRHRLFESNFDLKPPTVAHPSRHPLVFTKDKRKRHFGKLDEWSAFVSVNGGGNCSKAAAEDAMGVPAGWMTKDGLNQSIPPAYSEFLGRQIFEALTAERIPVVAERLIQR